MRKAPKQIRLEPDVDALLETIKAAVKQHPERHIGTIPEGKQRIANWLMRLGAGNGLLDRLKEDLQ